jgi:hypothetical protein
MTQIHRICVPDVAAGGVHRLGFQKNLWGFLLEGTHQALRLRVEGRSRAKGPLPQWLKEASQVEFQGYGDRPGELLFMAPALGSILDQDERQPLFPRAFTPDQTALELLEESIQDAIQLRRDSSWMDDAFLNSLETHLTALFKDTPALHWANGNVVDLNLESISRFDVLRRETPPKQRCRVTGKLEVIRHSDHAFALVLEDGRAIRGVAEPDLGPTLKKWWGEKVVVEGQAVFRASQNLLRIEAQTIDLAEERDAIWSAVPMPLFPDLRVQELHEVQGPKTGLAAIIGKWPGDESDEDLFAALEKLDRTTSGLRPSQGSPAATC